MHRKSLLAAVLLAGSAVGAAMVSGRPDLAIPARDDLARPAGSVAPPQGEPSEIDRLVALLAERDATLAERDAELARLSAALAARSDDVGRIEAKLAALEAELARLSAALGERDDEVARLHAALSARDAEAAALGAALAAGDLPPGAFYDRLKFPLQDAAASPEYAAMEIPAADAVFAFAPGDPAWQAPDPEAPIAEVHFEASSAALTPGGRQRALEAARALAEHATGIIRIAGHADRTGSVEVNRRLSRARAETVAAVLVAAGVPGEAIEIAAMGESADVLPVATADGVSEPLNRCVGIYVVAALN